MSPRQLSPTSFAILGLLSIQPFTTYELAQQMDRTVSWFWPRAASMIYEEPKKLVAEGLATSQVTFTGKRRSTVYEITDAGRASLRDWLDAPAAGMRVEFGSLRCSTDQRNTQPRVGRFRTACQSLRSPASCS
jgi:PadR family transcriptional regulator, regulatory protein AphA